MKKTYIQPNTQLVIVNTVGMIATSETVGFGSAIGSSETVNADGRRGGNVWEDDEDF